MMTIADQVNTIERALGERMLHHAFSILQTWVHELGLPHYQDRMTQLLDNYDRLFDYYLSADDPEREEMLDKLTYQAYLLVDDVYADVRLHRGLSPQMIGYNPDNLQSVMQYFNSCVHLQEEDLRWFANLVEDPERQMMAMLTIQSLSINLRECFNEEAMLALIEAMNSEVEQVANHATSAVIFLLAHYDVRVDYFHQMQGDFLNAIGDGTDAFETMVQYIELCRPSVVSRRKQTAEETLNQLLHLMQTPPEKRTREDALVTLLPESEREYMQGIVAILPDTWVFHVLVEDNEERESRVEESYLKIGRLEPMLERLPEAERWLVERLRSDKANALDYLNYGHCCFLRGDRMMAFESYRQARKMCDSLRSFYNIFRPDRGFLVDRGIPLEQVYMMEDQIIRSEGDA